MTSNDTCSHIQGRSLSVANSVNTPAQELVPSRVTYSHIQPFRCDQCNYSSADAQNLKKHKLKHTGAKPFACKQCSFSSRQSNDLKRHMLSHTGEIPFACKQCNYSCKRSNQLKMHMKKHSAKTDSWARMQECSDGKYHVIWRTTQQSTPPKTKTPNLFYTKLFDSPHCIILVPCNLSVFIFKLLSPIK